VRARELWRVDPRWLSEAQDDARLVAIRDQERAGLDIITDGEIRRALPHKSPAGAGRRRAVCAHRPGDLTSGRYSGRAIGRNVAKERRAGVIGMLGLGTRLGVRTGRTDGAEARSRESCDLPLSRGRLADEPVLVGGCLRVQLSGPSVGFVACHGSRLEEPVRGTSAPARLA
jgi:hypothetical protein